MAAMLVAKRRNLLFQLEDCTIQEALYKPQSVYLCPECGRFVRPHDILDGPRFKHMTRSQKCSYSRPSARNGRVVRTVPQSR